MSVLVHIIALMARYRWALLPVFLLLAFLAPWKSYRTRVIWVTGMILCCLGLLLGGPFLSNWCIYHVGEPATGQIISTYRPSTYDAQFPSTGYHVLLRSGSGQIIESQFVSSDFNLYPFRLFNSPDTADIFNVRYLPGFPRDLVLVTNDDSPWVKRERCFALATPMSTARNRFNFAQGAEPFRQPYIAAIDAYLQQGCASGERGREDYLELRARAVAGQVDPAP